MMTKERVHRVCYFPVCQILLQLVVRAVITSYSTAWTSSAGMLSTPADFPFFSDCTAASTSVRRMGWSSSVSVWGQFSTDRSPLALWLYSSEQYFVYWFSTSLSSVRHFLDRSWIVVAFLCFTVVRSFPSRYTLLLLFFLRFSSISLHCSILFSFCFFHAPLDVLVHFFLILRSFKFDFFFSVLSFRRTDEEFLQWPRVFSSDDVCKGSHWLLQPLLCWRWWPLNPCLHLHYSWWWACVSSWSFPAAPSHQKPL